LILFLCNHGRKKIWENVFQLVFVEWWEVVLEKSLVKGSLDEGYETTLKDFFVNMRRLRRCGNQELEWI
jgi:hypothetical protein